MTSSGLHWWPNRLWLLKKVTLPCNEKKIATGESRFRGTMEDSMSAIRWETRCREKEGGYAPGKRSKTGPCFDWQEREA